MTEIEESLLSGNEVACANIEGGCAEVIKKGDPYVMKGWYMFCCQSCADGEEV